MTYGAFFYNWDRFNIIVAQTTGSVLLEIWFSSQFVQFLFRNYDIFINSF